MTALLIDAYTAAWNERDDGARRRRIANLWTPDGFTAHRTLMARGHDAIEARVGSANAKWIGEMGYAFRATEDLQAHHDAVQVVWAMGAPNGTTDSQGFNTLLLAPDGRVAADYQFAVAPPPVNAETADLIERYVAFWNEASAGRRAELIGGLWVENGSHCDPHRTQHGYAEILGEAARLMETFAPAGPGFRCSGREDAHHDAVRFDWTAGPLDEPVASGGSFLLLGADGRIARAYTFDDPVPRRVWSA
jgi:hypothetical protein